MASVRGSRNRRTSGYLRPAAHARDRSRSGLATHVVGHRSAHETVAVETESAPTVSGRTIVPRSTGIARLAGRRFRRNARRIRQRRSVGGLAGHGSRLGSGSTRRAARAPNGSSPNVRGTRAGNERLSGRAAYRRGHWRYSRYQSVGQRAGSAFGLGVFQESGDRARSGWRIVPGHGSFARGRGNRGNLDERRRSGFSRGNVPGVDGAYGNGGRGVRRRSERREEFGKRRNFEFFTVHSEPVPAGISGGIVRIRRRKPVFASGQGHGVSVGDHERARKRSSGSVFDVPPRRRSGRSRFGHDSRIYGSDVRFDSRRFGILGVSRQSDETDRSENRQHGDYDDEFRKGESRENLLEKNDAHTDAG